MVRLEHMSIKELCATIRQGCREYSVKVMLDELEKRINYLWKKDVE